MRSRTLALVLFVAAVLLSPVRYVEACGPFFEDDVFVSDSSPDDFSAFGKGQLGILQSGYDSNEYAVAWRYLSGGRLSATELHAYLATAAIPRTVYDQENPTPEQVAAQQAAEQQTQLNAPGSTQWAVARAKYAPAASTQNQRPLSTTVNGDNVEVGEDYLNCPDPAYATAALTLAQRATAWGVQSPLLADWVRAQDAVFSNCSGVNAAMPGAVPGNSPALLKADRAYQIAAATFYAKQFDDAARQFVAIAADKNSPWSSWGQYLAARATVRLAFAMGKATDPYSGNLASYDDATMKRAQLMLEALLAQPKPEPSRVIVQSELNFVLARTDPSRRAADISAALAGPGPDANFAQDVKDLDWLLQKQAAIKLPVPLLAWIATWRGSRDAASAFARWQQDHTLPWLVVAIAKAGPSDSFVPQLLDEAAKVAPASPAYDTVFFHRVRLLIALKRADEARALLDATLPALQKQKPSSKLNALLGERMAAARDFNEFLQFAPRTLMSYGSPGADDLQGFCNERAHAVNTQAKCPELSESPWLDQDAVQVFNQQTPLALLIQAANSPLLPQNLRQSIALMAWTRSVLLQDATSAAALAPLLPKSVHDAAGSSVGLGAGLAILRNPGIRPYLEQGVPRVASYSEFDEFRDNWWCKHWDSGYEAGQPKPTALPVPSFIPADQLALAASQYEQLQQLPDSATVIGQRVVDYANQHPSDSQVPEALALTVRATHYACQTWDQSRMNSSTTEYTPVSKAAFELLHKRYPKSPWTQKTPYYY